MTAEGTDHADVLAALRAATASRHQRLDRAMPLAAAAPSLAHYGAHLRLLRGWLARIDAWLAAYRDGPQDATVLPPQARGAAIDADLADPAMPPLAPRLDAPHADWPHEADAAYRWGVCYVIEGSQLGGAVLFKQLRHTLAPHPLRYLGTDGAAVSARWQLFLTQLRRHVRTGAQCARACAGAQDAFDALLAALDAANVHQPAMQEACDD